MRVELRALSYQAVEGMWTGGNVGSALIKVVATNRAGQTYEKSYRGKQEVRSAFIGTQEINAQVVNGAVTEAVEQLFQDEELLTCLAES